MTFRYTYVVEYPDGVPPPAVHAHMAFGAGTVVAVQFNDALIELEHLIENGNIPDEVQIAAVRRAEGKT